MNRGRKRSHGFTLFELAFTIVIIVIVAALFVPVGVRPRSYVCVRQNVVQVRNIVQSLHVYAEFNNGRFPGVSRDGVIGDASVEDRLWQMMSRNQFTGEVAISPFESELKDVWTTGPLTAANYSYALLQLPEKGGRLQEWSNQVNPDAIFVSDRNLHTPHQPRSVQTEEFQWKGAVGMGDVSVQALQSPRYSLTRYGATRTRDDHLFKSRGPDDALMVYSGN